MSDHETNHLNCKRRFYLIQFKDFGFNFLQDFIAFLESNRSKFSKLRNLTVQLEKAPPKMTAQTMIAIVRNSNLDEFNCLTPLPPFTAQDQVKILESLKFYQLKLRCRCLGGLIYKSTEAKKNLLKSWHSQSNLISNCTLNQIFF